MTDGSKPLKNIRHEAFCSILAGPNPPNLTVAWCQSASALGREIPDTSPAQRVSASRTHSKPSVLDRISFLRRSRQADRPKPDSINAERLDRLMEEVTDAFLAAADAAIAAGVTPNQVAQIRQKLVVHAGRSVRLSNRTPSRETDSSQTDLPILHLCECRCTT